MNLKQFKGRAWTLIMFAVLLGLLGLWGFLVFKVLTYPYGKSWDIIGFVLVTAAVIRFGEYFTNRELP